MSLQIGWQIFFETLDLQTCSNVPSLKLPSGSYTPTLWLPREKVFVEIKGHGPNANSLTSKQHIRYQEAADQTGFILICVKGLPQPYRYTVRLYAPRNKAHEYPKFYWARFAEGERGKLCLEEGEKFMYLESNQAKIMRPPTERKSELMMNALHLGNASYLMGLQGKTVAKI